MHSVSSAFPSILPTTLTQASLVAQRDPIRSTPLSAPVRPEMVKWAEDQITHSIKEVRQRQAELAKYEKIKEFLDDPLGLGARALSSDDFSGSGTHECLSGPFERLEGHDLPAYVNDVLRHTDPGHDDSLGDGSGEVHNFVYTLLASQEEDKINLISSLNDKKILKSLSDAIRSNLPEELLYELTGHLNERPLEILSLLYATQREFIADHLERSCVDFISHRFQRELDSNLSRIESSIAGTLDEIEQLPWNDEGKRALGLRVIRHASDLAFKVKTAGDTQKSHNVGVGLFNPHNNCWVNSGLQMIARSPVMREWIDIISNGLESLPAFNQRVYAAAMCQAIDQFITEVGSDHRPFVSSVDTQVIRQAMRVLKPATFQQQGNSQEEAVELLTCLSDLADRILRNRPDLLGSHRSIKDQFRMFEKRIYQPTGACAPLAEEEREPDLYEPEGPGQAGDVPILVLKPGDHEFHSRHLQAFESNRGRISDQQRAEWEKVLAQAFLQRLFVEEGQVTKTFLDEVEGVRSKREYVSNQMTKRYEAPPSCLFFNINLDVYDRLTGRPSKLVTLSQDGRPIPVKVPLMERFTLPGKYVGETATYEVCSTIVHSGGAQVGHYIYYHKKEDGEWVRYNDTSVDLVHAGREDIKKALLQEASFVYYQKLAEVDPEALVIGELVDVEEALDRVEAAIPRQSPFAILNRGVGEGASPIAAGDENTSIFSSMLSYGLIFATGVRDILNIISYSITQSSYGFWLWLTGRNDKDSVNPPNGEGSLPSSNEERIIIDSVL